MLLASLSYPDFTISLGVRIRISSNSYRNPQSICPYIRTTLFVRKVTTLCYNCSIKQQALTMMSLNVMKVVLAFMATFIPYTSSFFVKTGFHGNIVYHTKPCYSVQRNGVALVMRKQKASNKRTSRLQKEGNANIDDLSKRANSAYVSSSSTLTSSPMDTASWKHKSIKTRSQLVKPTSPNRGGRGRGKKRTNLYTSLSFYHNAFCNLLTEEYQEEVNK